MLSPRIRFTVVDGEASFPVVELKRGWVVPSWKGVVDSIELQADGARGVKGEVSARIHSSVGVSGAYRIAFNATLAGERVNGSFVSETRGSEPIAGELTGTVIEVPKPVLDPAESVWTVQLVEAIPKGEVLTLYLNRSGGRFTSAIALSPNVSRRPFDVDPSELRLSDGQFVGVVSATRLNTREPDGGERSAFGRFEIDAGLDASRLRGRWAGESGDGQLVAGEVWGEVRPRRALAVPLRLWFKLEDGYAGGAMWQNRVFFKASFDGEGGLLEGRASNNKGVFEAALTAADVRISDDRVAGTLRSTVSKSGSVSVGEYSFLLDGQRAGDVFSGRFYTTFAGDEHHSGYFVGGIER